MIASRFLTPRFLTRCLMPWALVVAVAAPATVAAQGADPPAAETAGDADTRARDAYKKGDALYAEGDYEGAIEQFKLAYDLSQRPALLFNLANAYERVGRYAEALEALEGYAPTAPETDRERIRKRIDSLRKRVEEESQPAPAPTTTAAPTASAAPTAPPPASASQPPPPRPGPVRDPGEDKGGEEGSAPILGYTLLGVGGIGLAVGAFFGFSALGARDSAKKACSSDKTCPSGAQDDLDQDSQHSLIADISLGVGVAALAAGFYLVLTHDSGSSDASATTAIGAQPRAGGGEVQFVGRF